MAKCCPRVSRGPVGERYRLVMSPKGAEGVSELIRDGINADSPATKKGQSVAQGCRAELLGNVLGQYVLS